MEAKLLAAQHANWVNDIVKATLLMNVLQSANGTLQNVLWLLAYENLSKVVPGVIQNLWSNYKQSSVLHSFEDKKPNAFITCQKTIDTKIIQPNNKVDAILQHIASLKETKSLSYNGLEFTPDFKESVEIDSDIFFVVLKKEEDAKGMLSFIQFQIMTYEHDIHYLQKFLERCNEKMEQRNRNKLGNNLYYFDQVVNKISGNVNSEFLIFRKNLFHTTRTFENVFYEKKEIVRDRVRFFKTRRDWYEKKGIPYTLGFMFSGVPGCGKTSSIKAIANETNRHVIEVKLSEIKSNTQLKHLFYNEEIMVVDPITQKTETLHIPISERLYVIEDIDAMKSVVISRKTNPTKTTIDLPSLDEAEEDDRPATNSYAEFMNMGAPVKRKEPIADPLDLGTLLNILDGTLEVPGRIICITSNYPERLDDALVRPGRIDMIVHFKKCNRKILAEMFNSFYSESGHRFMESDFAAEYVWTPAEVNQIMFQNFDTPVNALRIINGKTEISG